MILTCHYRGSVLFLCRKRKAFSKQYHIELEEARKAIEEAKWKRGVPDETKFDRHIEEAALRREQRKEDPVEFIYSGTMSFMHYSTVLEADYDLASLILICSSNPPVNELTTSNKSYYIFELDVHILIICMS